MENLVLCPCGHPLTNHETAGCRGARRERCDCTRTRGEALEAAVESAKTRPWTGDRNSRATG